MKKYKTLLFDVDDTLLDFQKTEKVALRMLFEEKGIPLTSEVEARYKKLIKVFGMFLKKAKSTAMKL
ncbi:hypothetical protein BTGOE5_47100 [Bacillus thuringiensis]|nr:hypothetical protein BTGOE5_47100 [Bacillus thuringiensis]OFD03579.1 hypothetical protein BTGOE7_47650 [Bacillus thuringiensis]